jgi:hypothetical protein
MLLSVSPTHLYKIGYCIARATSVGSIDPPSSTHRHNCFDFNFTKSHPSVICPGVVHIRPFVQKNLTSQVKYKSRPGKNCVKIFWLVHQSIGEESRYNDDNDDDDDDEGDEPTNLRT